MVKKLDGIFFHKNEGEFENIDLEDTVFSDDTIIDLKGKIYKQTGIYPHHSYIWFKIKRDVNLAKTILYEFYYNTIKYDTEEDETWIRKNIVKDGLNRLGLGKIGDYPLPKDEERYTIEYFKRDDVVDIVSKQLTEVGVGYYVDNKNYKYKVPSANPFKLDDIELIPLPKKYIDETSITLEHFGDIQEIHVINGNILDDSIRKRYCPGCDLSEDSEIINLYENILYPKFKFIQGYRKIPGPNYITKKSLNNFVIHLNNSVFFPKHLDLDAIFNSFLSTKTFPYLETINNITNEKVHKVCLNPSTSIPFVDEELLVEWIKNDNKESHNYLSIKLLINKNTYGNVHIYKNGKIEFDYEVDEYEFKNINDSNPIFNSVITGINKIVKFLNLDYNKFVIDSIKNSDTVKLLNYIPKEATPLPNSGYNKIISKANLNIFIKLNKRLDPRFFPPFINCLHPFVKIENPELILNKKISFRTSMIDNFDKKGIINSISLRGKYNIASNISIDKLKVGDNIISEGGSVIWTISDISDTGVSLRHFKSDSNEILAKKDILNSTLKNYKLIYENVPVYNILNNESDLDKVKMIWKRVNNYKSLSNLGKEILEYISKGFLKEKDEGSEADNSIRRLLTIRHGSISKDELNELIIKIRRDGKKNVVEGHPGIPLTLDLNGIVDTDKDKKRSYIYKMSITELDNLEKIDDICDFFNKLFHTYNIWYNSHIEGSIKVVCKNIDSVLESKSGETVSNVCNEINFIDVGTTSYNCTKCKQPLDIVGVNVDIFKKVEDINGDFRDLIDKYDFQMDYDVKEKSFKCEREIIKSKDDITTSSSEDSEESNEDDDDEESDIDGIDWGIDFGSDDDDEESDIEDEVDVDEIQNEIAIKCPEEMGDYKSPEDWGNTRKNEMMIMSYEESNMRRDDERMRDKFILSKLYERDPLLFKWQRVNYEPYSRLCQPTDRYPIILNDSEKDELDERVKNQISDPYAKEGSNSCSADNGNSENCGAIKYGSTDKKQHWFICPKIWCPVCKISISEDKIVDKQRCPNCNREVVDRSKWYNDEDGKPMYGWPGFENSSRHPKNLWVPCCFNSISDGNPKPQIANRIKDAFNIDSTDTTVVNQKYIIKLKTKILEKGRFGILNDNINDLFKKININKEDISAIPKPSKNINLFFRCGIGNSFETRDFLSLIINIYNNIYKKKLDRNGLIMKIISGISKKEFSTLNRGILEILFRDIQDNITPFQNFIEYISSKEVKRGEIRYQYLWDLCTRPNNWLFKEGINLIIIDGDKTDKTNVICPPFPFDNFKSDLYVLAIRYKSGDGYIFEPIYNIASNNITDDWKKTHGQMGSIIVNKKNVAYKNVYKTLHKKTSNCKITPNFNLLANIYKRRGTLATPIRYPLYKLKQVKIMLSSHLTSELPSLSPIPPFTGGPMYIPKYYISDEYNKIIGLAVYSILAPPKKDCSKTLFFIPVYPSGPIKGEEKRTKRINDVNFTDFYCSYYFLEQMYRLVVERGDDIKRINVLPREIILNNKRNKIIAIVTNSNSIIPIRETEIDTIKKDDDEFTFDDIQGVKRVIKISKRKYYKNLDSYIRERPIGILQYSKEKILSSVHKILPYKIKNIILSSSKGCGKNNDNKNYFVLFVNDSDEEILIPFSYDKNKNYVDKLDISVIKDDIKKWILENNISNFEMDKVLDIYNKTVTKYNLHMRPIRYIMNNNKEVCGLILENGLEIPIKDTYITEAIEINHDFTPLDEIDNIDYYYELDKKDDRIRKIAMLKYEDEIFNIIKYEFSKYLQTKEGKEIRKKIIKILNDNEFDLLHTKLARNELSKILNNYLNKHSIPTNSNNLIKRGLENYNVPLFREHYAEESAGRTDVEKCNKNPHYYYKKGTIKKKTGKISKLKNSGCKIVIPRENLIHNIKKNQNNKIYRIVDEIIRNKNIRMEILDNLVPKSIINEKYVPLDKGEVVFLTDKNTNIEERLITLYKRKISLNLRRDEYGEVIPTLDNAYPEEMVSDPKNEKISRSLTYLDNKSITINMIGTGEKINLF